MHVTILAVLLPDGQAPKGGRSPLAPISVLGPAANIPEGGGDWFALDGVVLGEGRGIAGLDEGHASGRVAAWLIRAEFVAGWIVIEEVHGTETVVEPIGEDLVLLPTTQVQCHVLPINISADIHDSEDITSANLPSDSLHALAHNKLQFVLVVGQTVADGHDKGESGVVSDDVAVVGETGVDGVDHVGGDQVAELETTLRVIQHHHGGGNTEILAWAVDDLHGEGCLIGTREVSLRILQHILEHGVGIHVQFHRLIGKDEVFVVVRIKVRILWDGGIKAGRVHQATALCKDHLTAIGNVAIALVKMPVGILAVEDGVPVPKVPVDPQIVLAAAVDEGAGTGAAAVALRVVGARHAWRVRGALASGLLGQFPVKHTRCPGILLISHAEAFISEGNKGLCA